MAHHHPPGRVRQHGPALRAARYRLTLNNVIYCQGRVTCQPALRASDAPKTIAVLGPDARPGGDLVFAVPTGAIQNMARVVVTAQGEIVFGGLLASNNPAADAINLPGIVFSIEGVESFAVQALASRSSSG